jgi:hypothetical protein
MKQRWSERQSSLSRQQLKKNPMMCSLSDVHQRLEDAARMWKRANESYFSPDDFRVSVLHELISNAHKHLFPPVEPFEQDLWVVIADTGGADGGHAELRIHVMLIVGRRSLFGDEEGFWRNVFEVARWGEGIQADPFCDSRVTNSSSITPGVVRR